jgi:transcriptional regulator with XRE-family HTH domain
MKTYSQDDVLKVIRQETDSTSIRQTAKRLGISPAYLSDVLLGNRGVSENIAAAFGFKRIITSEIRFKKAS